MVSRTERTILAAIISLTCFCFSFYWYKNGRKATGSVNRSKPIAYLEDSTAGVQRKPARRVIWQRIAAGDMLYAKEAIRTPSDSSAEITFIGSDTKIELEPDSVIVLEETSGDVALNFLKGNVFVAGGGGGGLKIKSGDSVVEAGSGELNLSKGAGKDLELQVLKGNAKLNANGKSIELKKNQIGKISGSGLEVEKDLLEIKHPISNSKVFVDFLKKEAVQIAWKKVSDDYDYELLAGNKKDRMQKMQSIEVAKTGDRLTASFKPGFVYWQLLAKPKKQGLKQLKSAVLKIKVVSIKPPAFVEPQQGQKLRLKPEKPVVELRWTDPMKMKDVQVQVWKVDKNGRAVEGSEQTASVKDNRYVQAFKSGGDYSARVTGFLKTGAEQFRPISSEVVNFKVSLSNKLEPPVLKAPLAKQRIRFTRARESGLFLSWEPVPGAKKYRVKIKKPGKKNNVVDQELVESVFDFKTFAPGEYVWSVASVGESGKRSKFGEKRRFTVTDVPVLAWSEEAAAGNSFYVGKDSVLSLGWQAGPKEAVSYRVLYSPQGEWGSAKTKVVNETLSTQTVPRDGLYEAQVQAPRRRWRNHCANIEKNARRQALAEVESSRI